MLILHTSYHTAGINQPELVDGQQRMTTLVLLLKAFENAYRSKGKEERANEIRKMILCKGLDDVERPKIKLGDLDNDDIHNLILHDEINNIKNVKIKDAYVEYLSWLSELEILELNTFYFKLTNVAVIIRLDVAMAQDAYKLFETINNRGLRLTPTDIIKNFLLGHAAKMNDEPTLERVKSLWSKIIMNLDDIDTDDFLRQYICSILNRKVTKTSLVREFKKYYLKHIEKADLLGEYAYYQEMYELEDNDEDDPETISGDMNEDVKPNGIKFSIVVFLERLVSLSAVYRKLSNATYEIVKINRHIQNLNQILSKPSYIFLMHFLIADKYSENEKISVLKYIETLMLRRHTCERRTSENDDIFSKMVPLIGEENILEKIREYIDEDENMPPDNDFELNFPKYQFKGILIDRAKYVLETIEYYKRGNTKELLIASNNEVHLEHIIPQTINTKRVIEEFGDWVTYLCDKSVAKHKKYVNYIGNMTLLGESLNIQAFNNPFTKKKASYKKSNILITNELANQNDFKFSHVDKRSDQLTALALKIWKS